MTSMTITAPARVPAGVSTEGGQFSKKEFDDDALNLNINPYDTIAPLTAAESKSFVESALVAIDGAWISEDTAETNIDDGTAAGTAHANAEIIAYIMSDNLRPYDYEAIGESLLNDRREGHAVELGDNWAGPGELTALKRQTAVDRFRTRADELFAEADAIGVPADVAAHTFARSEVFAEAALDLSGEHVFYTGE